MSQELIIGDRQTKLQCPRKAEIYSITVDRRGDSSNIGNETRDETDMVESRTKPRRPSKAGRT